MNRGARLQRTLFAAAAAGLVLAAAPELPAQEGRGETDIAFETELPRTLVFISERGEGEVATRDVNAFLRSDAAGPFPEDHILYLLPHDTDLGAMAATAFPMWDVKTAVRRHIASERVVVIADACHSAGTADSAIPGVEKNAIAGGFQMLFTPSRRLSITAAAANEFSLEDARWDGGVFTHYLMRALRGDGDGNGDDIVSFTEAYEYVSENVVEATDGRQNPQRTGVGDVPLSVAGEGTATGQDGGG